MSSQPASSPKSELRVQTLGQLAIFRGRERLPENAWGREKARHLFQYFITYRQRLITRERIVAELWPDLEFDRAARDFKVALNALNAALEPDRPPRTLSQYVARQGASYGLNPETPIGLDVAEFESGIAAGSRAERRNRRQAIELYRPALQLYQGEYLPDLLYVDWTSVERERLASLFLTAASRLSGLLLEEGETVEMVMWCQKVISIDNCWEEAYRLLMRGHMVNGNRPLAIRAYRQCRQILDDELGLEPMAETTGLYEQILSGEGI